VQAQCGPPSITISTLLFRVKISRLTRYWNDPFKHDEYLQRNIFLPDLNNELDSKNMYVSQRPPSRSHHTRHAQRLLPLTSPASFALPSVYKQRLLSLKSLVLVMFTRDSMVHSTPPPSTHTHNRIPVTKTRCLRCSRARAPTSSSTT
jgi:hypothetical protein